MKGENLQQRLLYPGRISFRFNGEIKTFTDNQKLREFSTTNPALQQLLKNFSRQETQEKEKTYNIKPKTVKKMKIGKRIVIITLNVNELNAQPKDIDWGNGDKNKTCIYAVYRRPTSDLGTHTD